MMTKKRKHVSRQPPCLALLGQQMDQLRQAERQMEELFRRVVCDLDEERLARASEQIEDLVLSFPELRLPNLREYPDQARTLLSRLDLEAGPLPGFYEVVAQIFELCVTPQAIDRLRHKLYRIAAYVAESCPELLPAAAIAFLSLDPSTPSPSAFVEMVICASAIETSICAGLEAQETVSLDVSAWLAAEPSAALLAAVGEGQAYYYASIAGVLLYLDQGRVLLDIEQLGASVYSSSGNGHCSNGLDSVFGNEYKALLCTEIKRTQHILRQQYPANSIADLEMLTRRALDALDHLPPQVNPLLQAIFVQSWVRYFTEMC